MTLSESVHQRDSQAYLVGGGIASLAAAAFLIRDAGFSGTRIHVFEQSEKLGGSLDGSGTPDDGYVIRGGRMFEEHFVCTYDLFDSIPSLDDAGRSVTEAIHEFTARVVTSSKCRLVSQGERIEAPKFGLSLRDKWDLLKLGLRSENSLEGLRIDEYFKPRFFGSNFWVMWSTMFAFQPWHAIAEFRRYQLRFLHLLPGFNRMEGIFRTVYNQYDSLILPLSRWLEQEGVTFHLDSPVANIQLDRQSSRLAINRIDMDAEGPHQSVDVSKEDLVFVTLGSMTESSHLGSMTAAPELQVDDSQGSWALWKKIADISSKFSRPEVFCSFIERSKWESFTVTLPDPGFFQFMEDFTGNAAGTGGLVTFKDSNWCLSVVLAHQPHFINQPEDVYVFWGYGLSGENPGNHVSKKMSECTGEEILKELAFHLRLDDRGARYFEKANCIPCMMPYITSQFSPRKAGDRPTVVPDEACNFAFLGQFCELPEDTVFTVEYSIRSAHLAVSTLLDLPKKPAPVFHGVRHPSILMKALWTLATS